MDFRLKDKSVLVMAFSACLGKAAATEFSREGANVMLFSPFADEMKAAQVEMFE